MVNIIEGGEVLLDCNVKGTPTPEIIWRKDGVNINSPLRSHIQLKNLTKNDSGRLNFIVFLF